MLYVFPTIQKVVCTSYYKKIQNCVPSIMQHEWKGERSTINSDFFPFGTFFNLNRKLPYSPPN